MGLIFKSKKEKQEDKELKQYLDELDRIEDEVLSEEEKKRKEEEKGNPVIQLLNIFDDDPEDKELKKYMTPKQLEQEQSDKNYAKLTIIIASFVMIICTVGAGLLSYIYYFNNQNDLNRVYKFDILDYYQDRYGSSTKLNDINYICYDVKDEEGHTKQECTDIIYSRNTDNKVIMLHNNEYADNISISSYYDDYNKYLDEINPNLDIIWHNVLLSDKDYYHDFYQYEDYINVMPANSTFNTLLKDNKLNIVDVVMYQGTLNEDNIKNLLTKLADDSIFIFIKSNVGSPINMKVFTKNNSFDIPVVGQSYPIDHVVYYQLDTTKNNISGVTIAQTAAPGIKTLSDGYEFSEAYRIGTSTVRRSSKEDRSIYPEYFLVMFDNILNGDLKQFSSSNELKPDKYVNYYSLSFGGKTYIIASRGLGIGTIKKTSSGLFN